MTTTEASAEANPPNRLQPVQLRRGWRTRGRLPHADFAGLTQAVTFRLADALPGPVLDRLQRNVAESHPDPADARRAALLRVRVHAWLYAGHGSGCLCDPAAMAVVAEELHRSVGISYRLEAFTIMPNHVHVVVGVGGRPLGAIIGAWKGASARRINRLQGKAGRLWNREYYDRFIRDDDHGIAAIRYVVRIRSRRGWSDAGGWRMLMG
jgi:REP element-mobilizing transposase RayT